jgi:putative peptide maturation dehydrogenase
MPWVHRTGHLALTVADDDDPRVAVRSLLTGKQVRLEAAELEVLLALPTRSWTWWAENDSRADELGRAGLVVSDDLAPPFPDLRQRDEELTALGWWPDAAALHTGSRWDGARARVLERDGSRSKPINYAGSALPALPVRGGTRTPLPRSGADSPLRQVLSERRTVRLFDDSRPVDIAEFATLLRWVWGAHGTLRLRGDDVGLRRTSPSGGALHPIEVYAVVRRVEGVPTGLYHYLGGMHELEVVAEMGESAARTFIEDATAGQWYLADADVAFLMTARFGRSFRKYRLHPKVYRTVLLDVGHLSQTFYLLCTELGLGPWVTSVLDEGVLERALGVEPLEEGLIAVCGCGRPKTREAGGEPLEPRFVPLDPG